MNGIFLALACGLWAGSQGAEGAVDLRFLRPIDTAGAIHSLADNADRAGTALVFVSPAVEASRDAIGELNRIADAAGGIAVYAVVTGSAARRSDAAALAERTEARIPVLFDATGELFELLAPTHFPEAFLLNADGELVYRGRVSGEGEGLSAAAEALAAGRAVATARTEPAGEAAPEVGAPAEVTFARHVAPIFYANCTECHRPGQVGPFALLTHEDAAKRASFLAEVTGSRLMPPWKAEIGYGHFEDERRLTDRQVELVRAWAESGAALGDVRDMPPAPRFAEGWRLGEPDVVVEAPVAFEVPADGPDIFQHFVIPVELPEDKTLIGFEFRPSNPVVSHHAVVFLDESGQARALDAETPEPGYRTSGSVGGGMTALVGVWTPGMTPRFYPEGIGIRMPRKVDVVLQLHLHPSGKTEYEQSKIALYFSDKPAHEMRRQEMLLLGSLAIDIPPGRERHEIQSSFRLPIDATLLSVFPHLHLIGKEMKVTATLPSGETTPLIWIKDWNFYWQDSYQYKRPVKLPKGTRIDVQAAYNNSAENPMNPSQPPQRVLFGNGSTDEMCFAFFQITTDERQAMMRIAPALMQSFLAEWRKADIDDAARERIVDEAGKLFGRRSTEMLRTLLLPGRGRPTPEEG